MCSSIPNQSSPKKYIEKCLAGEHLSVAEATATVETIMSGAASDAQIAGLLTALRAKGETVDELLGFAQVMRSKATSINVDDDDAVDIVGTGGDGLGTFNISTVTSFVVAGAGITVAKHGNRSVSSRCGSADVLAALGVNIELPPTKVAACINTVGLGFMFAPLFHPAMKVVAKCRTELGVRTILNLLGPLINPAGVKRALIGTFNPIVAGKLAGVLDRMKMRKAFVVNSSDGMDEIALSGVTSVHEITSGSGLLSRELEPEQFGFERQPLDAIRGGTSKENAVITRNILAQEDGPCRDIVIMNAAAAIYIAGKTKSLEEAKEIAVGSIVSGRALEKLNQLVEFTNRV